MRYRLRYGVVMVSICDAQYVFASRKALKALPILIRISEEVISALNNQNDASIELSDKAQSKMQRLIRMGYIEEY